MTSHNIDEIPDWLINKWQGIADLLAKIIDVPAALIMKTENEFMEVFISSKSANNPYHVGDKEKWFGLYCETVIKSQEKLIVPNALIDEIWNQNPDIKLGMIAYLGFPINFPDGKPFGTICVLDKKENKFSDNYEQLILQFKDVIENDLFLLHVIKAKTSELNNIILEQNESLKVRNEQLEHLSQQLQLSNKELQKSKEVTKESEEKYRTLIETANEAISIVEDGLFRFVNNKLALLLGKPIEELIGIKFIEFVWPEDRDMIFSNYLKRIAGKNVPNKYDFRVIGEDGNPIWVLLSAEKIQWEGKSATINLLTDIDARKKSEEALLQKTALFDALLNTTLDGILIIDSEGKKVLQNKRTVELFKIPEEFANNIDDQYQLQYVTNVNKNPEQFAQKVFYLYEHPEETSKDEIELKDGTIMDRYSAPVLGKDGQNYGRIWSFRDITEQKQAEIELLTAKEKAEENDRLKTAFLQNMSHEIRTPMNAIMGFSDLLIRFGSDKSKQEQYSKIIKQRCKDLLVIIEDILDISRIESGQIPVNIDKFNLNSLLFELNMFYSAQQVKLGKQHIQLKINIDNNHSQLLIATDKVKLQQIFINLIGNAFKFTDKGTIECGFKFGDDDTFIFYVSDTGIGIPLEKQQKIFERFFQLEPSPTRLYGGTGLGLSIVKGLVDLLGGKIWLESDLGKGSIFYFSIPAEHEYSAKEEQEVVVDEVNFENYLLNKLILVVEDDNYNASYINEILTEVGLRTVFAQYGYEAIHIATTQEPDLVLMDIGLSDMSGYEAIKKIKQQKPDLKIIAQTAYATLDDRRKTLEAGCVDYISKPLNAELLLSMINKHLTDAIHL